MRNDTLIVYIHGKGGTAEETEHYKPLFPDCDVVGLTYSAETPWDAKSEFPAAVQALAAPYRRVILIANSIGAYFSLCALPQEKIERAYFISPVVDMKKLIGSMMAWASVSEDELREKGTIETAFGETLSWDYLSYVRAHPICWKVPTAILYGGRDDLTDRETITAFAAAHRASLTVMEEGEHWFHTPEQLAFLDEWLLRCERDPSNGSSGRTKTLRRGDRLYLNLRQRPQLKERAAEWFYQKWNVPKEAYLACMDDYLSGKSEYGWFLCLDGDKIVAGLGVIENDFHNRKDLTPNVCAVYTEPDYRCKGIAGDLLSMAVEDLRSKGVSPVYLLTDHTGFYERYGWEFLCMVKGDGEPELSRMYLHR